MRIREIINQISKVSNGIGVSALAVMMLVTTADVCGRYFLNKPIFGAYEITEILMILVVFLGLAHTAINKGHISLDVLVGRFPARAQAFIEIIWLVLAIFGFSLIAWQGLAQSGIVKIHGEVTSLLMIPIFPLFWIITFGSVLLCLVLLLDLVSSVRRMMASAGWKSGVALLAGAAVILALCSFPLWGRELWQVSPDSIGFIAVAVLLVLLFLGMPVAFNMLIVGFLGLAYVTGFDVALTPLRTGPYTNVASFALSVVPLFVLMGTFAFYSGLSKDLFYAAYTWFGRLRGGLAMASVASCAAFAAVSGSSLATAATMGAVALPEMKRYKYSPRLATGSVAAGGTIGALIPPSVLLIIYALLTDESIGKLFLAGFLPGILEAVFYIVTILILCKRDPLMGPAGPVTSWKTKFVSLKDGWQVLVLFGVVMGGIYTGIFSPTEAAAVGAFLAFVFALAKKRLTWRSFADSLLESGKMTAMVFAILIGAAIFGYLLAITQLPYSIAELVASMPVNRYITMMLVIVIYIILGCFISSLPMVILTVPIFFPLVLNLGFDPIWFGIIVVRVTELAQITPPYGINVFIIKGVAKDVSIGEVYKGVVPFIIADVLNIALLLAVPQIATFLPGLMK